MPISPEVRDSLIRRYSTQGGLDRALLESIIDEVADAGSDTPDAGPRPASPFDVSWMDSYVAYWALGQSGPPPRDRFEDVAQILRGSAVARSLSRTADHQSPAHHRSARQPWRPRTAGHRNPVFHRSGRRCSSHRMEVRRSLESHRLARTQGSSARTRGSCTGSFR